MIFHCKDAFAALTEGGDVISWGDKYFGGNSDCVQDQLKNVKMIFSSPNGFLALTSEGNLVRWGYGKLKIKTLQHIKNVFPSFHGFSALTENNEFITVFHQYY
jgi:hypothetical protein